MGAEVVPVDISGIDIVEEDDEFMGAAFFESGDEFGESWAEVFGFWQDEGKLRECEGVCDGEVGFAEYGLSGD